MLAFTVQNFVSAAAGMAVAVAIIRGIMRRSGRTLGNFWVDLVRGVLRILLPISSGRAVVFVGLGAVQNLNGSTVAATVDRSVTATVTDEDGTESTSKVTEQAIPGGPVASQEVIKELGTNGGGFFNTNGAHPFENPNGWTNLLSVFLLLLIPFAFPVMFGRMLGQPRQGWVLLGVMALMLVSSMFLMSFFETGGNPEVTALGVDQELSRAHRPAATWRARRPGSVRRAAPSTARRRRAPPPARSTACTTRSPRPVAQCRWS